MARLVEWYAVAWRWKDDGTNRRRVDYVRATMPYTAEKQLAAKLRKEYAFKPADLIILETFRHEPPEGHL